MKKNKNENKSHDSADFNNNILLRNIKIYLKFFHNKDFLSLEMCRKNLKVEKKSAKNSVNNIDSSNNKFKEKNSNNDPRIMINNNSCLFNPSPKVSFKSSVAKKSNNLLSADLDRKPAYRQILNSSSGSIKISHKNSGNNKNINNSSSLQIQNNNNFNFNESKKSIFDLFYLEDEQHKENSKYKEFRKPLVYKRFMLALVFLMISIAVLAGFFIHNCMNNFQEIELNFKFLDLFSQKNFAFEIFLIFKYNLINFDIESSSNNNNNSDLSFKQSILFEETLSNYENIKKELKNYLTNNPSLSEFQALESELNSKAFCNKFANFTYFNKFKENSVNENNLFQELKNNCLSDSGGLNMFGLEQSVNTIINVIKNYYMDLNDFISRNQDIYKALEDFRLKAKNNELHLIDKVNLKKKVDKLIFIAKSFVEDISYE